MKLLERIKAFFQSTKQAPEMKPQQQPEIKPKDGPAGEAKNRVKKVCKGCGKTFSVDPSWEHIPNYCKACKQRFAKEKEEKQRAGAPRKIRRTCRQCGKVFTFPNTLEHYPNYCPNCRKAHQAAMKEKYAAKSRSGKQETKA